MMNFILKFFFGIYNYYRFKKIHIIIDFIKENYYITIISNPTDKCKDYVIWDTCENNTDWEENNEKTGF